MPPTVSINLCCYNSEKYLRETLDSIINQSYRDWELVIINDGSKDSTELIIKEYIDKGYPIVYHYQENHGLGYSRNEALKRSRGEFIAFIDHDDIWVPEKLEKQMLVFHSNSEVDFVYSNYFLFDQFKNKRRLADKKLQPSGFVFEHLLHQYSVGILTVLVRRSSFNKLSESFDSKLKLSEDYDVFMRILYYSKALYINEPLAVYRIHSNMSSICSMEKYPDEIACVAEKLKMLDKDVSIRYEKAFKDHEIQLDYLRAKIKIAQGELKKARSYLVPYKLYNTKFFVLFYVTYIPSSLWLFMSPLWENNLFRRLT